MTRVKPTKIQELECQVSDKKRVIQTQNHVIMVKIAENIELQKELIKKDRAANLLHEIIGKAEARYRQSELEKEELLKKT
ncbi:MAG: hypothetical protein ACRC6X_01010 [Culicoidibacterales bacterium]